MDFEMNLEKLRKLYPVKTICMHGSPLSKIDNRDLWKKYDYLKYGIIGEPYFDIDYDEVLYLTDTGRRWDGERMNVRDRVNKKTEDRRQKKEVIKSEARNSKFETNSNDQNKSQEIEVRSQESGENELKTNTSTSIQKSFHSTNDIIRAAREGRLPEKMMINIHPQRWNDQFIPWAWELVSQNVKNVVKKWFFVKKNS